MPLLSIVFLLLAAGPLQAHGTEGLTAENAWSAWRLTPEVVAACLFVLWVYLRGLRRLRAAPHRRWWRHLLFFAGLTAVFVALQSPLDPLAERSFALHQIQHLLLRMSGPMLLALSAPQAVLVAGLPRVLRRRLLRPLAASRALGALLRGLRRPLVAWLLFVGTLYLWQLPAVHNNTLLSDALHYTMHVTMLLSGLLFFFVVFDLRAPPRGVAYGLRQIMLLAGIVSNIVLGALITLKETVTYDAYDIAGRLFTTTAVADEQTGGYIIWVPGSMMLLVSVLVLIFRWNGFEAARHAARHSWRSGNSAALEFPETAEELWLKVEGPNRTTRLVLAAIPLTMFVVATGTALAVHYLR